MRGGKRLSQAVQRDEPDVKELIFEIMGKEIDLYYEFRNQKEALIRKENIINELASIIKSMQELDESDD